ncbi:MAG: hypothetical protein JO129_04750 [Candidatus Dependentiae bacterium]|nr:hypothetical protein [Candidatus Dependentiae bacterium]
MNNTLKSMIFLIIVIYSGTIYSSEKQQDFGKLLQKIYEARNDDEREKTFGEYFEDKYNKRMEDLKKFKNSQILNNIKERELIAYLMGTSHVYGPQLSILPSYYPINQYIPENQFCMMIIPSLKAPQLTIPKTDSENL